MTQLTDKLKNQSESNKQAQDNLHKQVQEQKTLLRSAQDRAQTLETSITELTAQLTDTKEKVAQLDVQVCQHHGAIQTWCNVMMSSIYLFISSAEGKNRAAAVCRSSQGCTESQPGEQPGGCSAHPARQTAGQVLVLVSLMLIFL